MLQWNGVTKLAFFSLKNSSLSNSSSSELISINLLAFIETLL